MVKPLACSKCMAMGVELHAHHVTPYAQLKREGRADDIKSHVLKWLCVDCHEKEHEHEPVIHLMRSRRRKRMS